MPDSDGKPLAFLSHASEDKESFVEPLGRELARLGIRPWLDKWEIRPGDSLVQKLFDEGIGRADAVVVVVSEYSATKAWVRDELDSATVARVVKGTRLIPVRLDDVEVPQALAHLAWINASRSQDGIRDAAERIASAVHGTLLAPTVASLPAYVENAPAIPGLTPIDAYVLSVFVEEALEIGFLMPLDWRKIEAKIHEAGVASSALNESLHALAVQDLVNLQLKGTEVYSADLTHEGFATAIGSVIPDIDQVHLRVIALLVNDPPMTTTKLIQDLAETAGTTRLVVDELLYALELRDYVVVIRTLGDHSRLHRISPTLGRLLS